MIWTKLKTRVLKLLGFEIGSGRSVPANKSPLVSGRQNRLALEAIAIRMATLMTDEICKRMREQQAANITQQPTAHLRQAEPTRWLVIPKDKTIQ